jgi:NAD(P)-dependent dehydrogenase (short-subunit alcohol dehydrogenase family)
MGALENKIVIVTGAGGGIGGAIVRRCAREGARLAVVDIDRESAVAAAAQLTAQGVDAVPIIVDVTKQAAVRDMVHAVLERWARIDILVNVAGGAERKPVVEMTAAEWDYVVDLNVKSAFLCSQAALPAMLQQHYGKIVNISSIYGFTGNATRSSYAAAKAAVAAFTKSLALEVVKDGVNVNAVAPGRVTTPRVRGRYSDEAWAAAVAQVPMGRAGTPEEIASAVVFLASDENSYITGQTVHVNGAWLNW